MKLRLASLALIAAFLGTFVLAPLSAEAQLGAGFTRTVTGTVTDADTGDPLGMFNGEVTLDRFVNQNGQLALLGSLEGTFVGPEGVTQEVTGDFTTLIDSIGVDAACQILDLDIGAIHLDLLGLVVDIAPIAIDITAVPGPGNLLGNLLCAIAGLLDGGPLNGLIGLLNNLLRHLG